MTNNISENKFYRTFIPFISQKTLTAEKTMNGKVFITNKHPPDIKKEIYKFFMTGTMLLFPLVAIGFSRKSIKSVVKQADLDYFRTLYSEPPTFRRKLYLKVDEYKSVFGKKFLKFFSKQGHSKDNITSNLNKNSNNQASAVMYRNFNNIFKSSKSKAAKREYAKMLKEFDKMEKLVLKQVDIIENSSNGDIRILFNKNLF